MRVFKLQSDLNDYLSRMRLRRRKIGLVPTMGALHEGHMALIKASREEADITVCTIFVNPAQFNNPDDLLKYPRSLEDDLEKLKATSCEVAYAPEASDLYDLDMGEQVRFDFGNLGQVLEGHYRPGHFNGVALVVLKFFNIVQPDITFFGQKDLQQFHIIRTLIHDLSYHIQLRLVPTVREKDGLAMSSRNRRIPEGLRPLAGRFYECLIKGREMLYRGSSVKEVKQHMEEVFKRHPELELEYFEVVDTFKFTVIDDIQNKESTALCIAGYLNNIRLIDNVMYI